MTALEQELANIASLLLGTAGTLVAQNNPAYADTIATVNATAQALLGQTSATANVSTAVAAAVQPVTSAIATVGNSAATAQAKAGAVSTLVSEVIGVGGEIWSWFHTAPASTPAPKATVLPAPAPAASA